MHTQMTIQIDCWTETHWAFTTNVRLQIIMTTKYMELKVTTVVEFLLTNVTRVPTTFIVRRQQMSLELVAMCETLWTMST